jgi:hypothetical protein
MTLRPFHLLPLFLLSACGSGSSDGNSSAAAAAGGGGGAAGVSGSSGAAGAAGAATAGGGDSAGGASQDAGAGGASTAGQNACCDASDTPGCADDAIQTCICDIRPECCSAAWDAACVALVDEKRCEPDVRTCVCQDWQQSQCCDTEWTTLCAFTAEDKCGGSAACVDPLQTPPTATNACCEAATTPGCSDTDIETCVCDQLPDCCTTAWDSVCVELVRQQTCAPDVRTCVCQDWGLSECCDTQWTDFCTITAEQKCNAQNTCG